MAKRNSILVVEDEPTIRMALADHLSNQGYEVMEADSGEGAMDVIKRTEVDLLVTDVEMPGWQDGIGLALWVREHHPLIQLIIVSGAKDESPSLKQLGDEGIIYTKPYSVEEISNRARFLLQQRVSKPVGGD